MLHIITRAMFLSPTLIKAEHLFTARKSEIFYNRKTKNNTGILNDQCSW